MARWCIAPNWRRRNCNAKGLLWRFIDLRSLSPYDWESIARTVKKTNRVIVAYEDMRSWGYGAEIAARIADELFEELDAPVRSVAAMDSFCAYQPHLEEKILPQSRRYRPGRARISRFLTSASYRIPCRPLRHNLHM